MTRVAKLEAIARVLIDFGVDSNICISDLSRLILEAIDVDKTLS